MDLRNLIFTHVRAIYNAPLGFAGKLVRGILEDESRMTTWKRDIKIMADRIRYYYHDVDAIMHAHH